MDTTFKPLKIIKNNIKLSTYKYTFNSSIGYITLLFDNNYLWQILFGEQPEQYSNLINHLPSNSNSNVVKVTQNNLNAYFAKENYDFSEIPYKLSVTPFQEKVFNAMLNVKYGQTISYQELTNTYFAANAIRAVTSQIGKNPIPIIIPCHRIIGKNGNLTGYAGGLNIKHQLLNLEASENY